MAIDSTTVPSDEDQNYEVRSFNGRLTRHEYLHSQGIVTLGEETYRIRVTEQDDNLYIDAWEGEFDGRSFEPVEYVNSTRVYFGDEESPGEEVPSRLTQVEELLGNESIPGFLRPSS